MSVLVSTNPRLLADLDSDKLYEVVDGELVEVPAMGMIAGVIATELSRRLGNFASEHKLGWVVTEVMFRLPPTGNQRRPDIAFVAYDRWPGPGLPSGDPPAWEVAPNLIVEVVSPTDRAEELDEKVHEYLTAGVALVWVIYPSRRSAHVYQSPNAGRRLLPGDDLVGDPVLPGFRLRIDELFSVIEKPA
jgi:Uma2 family endonuclease